jgi:hypothetical protein
MCKKEAYTVVVALETSLARRKVAVRPSEDTVAGKTISILASGNSLIALSSSFAVGHRAAGSRAIARSIMAAKFSGMPGDASSSIPGTGGFRLQADT